MKRDQKTGLRTFPAVAISKCSRITEMTAKRDSLVVVFILWLYRPFVALPLFNAVLVFQSVFPQHKDKVV